MRKLLNLAAVLLFAIPVAGLAASFTQCPAVGNDTNGCELLITVTAVNSAGAATAFTVTASSPDQGPYDGADDTLVGVLNNSGGILKTLGLSSSTDIFAFEGDGACTYITCTGATDPSGYAPAGVTFSGINGTGTSGTVNFTLGVANNGSSWFSLEEALTPSQIQPSAPEPASILMSVVGFAGIGVAFARRRRRAA